MNFDPDNAWRDALRPEPALTVSEWADRYRRLSTRDSAEPGQWRTSRTPYLRAIMDCLSPQSPIERVVFMKGAQLGATALGMNWLGYIMHRAPGPVLCVQPSLDMAKRFSRQRLEPLIEGSPVLRDRVSKPRARDASNTMFAKDFPGGALILTGANSPTGLRSMPARYVMLDEIDGYPISAGEEGDPVSLAMARQETFHNRKTLLISTPTIKGISRIAAAFEETDKRLFFVPCPHCGDMQPITWARIQWPEGRRHEAGLHCEACGAMAYDSDKGKMLAGGEWRATAEGDGRSAGFHLSALYSPWKRWRDVAMEHKRVLDDPARLQVWVNTTLGEVWDAADTGDEIEAEVLAARRETWAELPSPVITAGVDTQDDRLEASIVAWGPDEESYVLSHHVLYGDPAQPKVWDDLDELLKQPFRAPSGLPVHIMAVAVDSGGHHTKAAYAFCMPRFRHNVWAVRGRGGTGIPVWPVRASVPKATRPPVFSIGVDAIKDSLFARLRMRGPGPGYVHFNASLDLEYFRQLTSERAVVKYTRGRQVRSYQVSSKGIRNEALDCYVYSAAALQGLIQMRRLSLKDAATRGPAPKRPTVVTSNWLAGNGDTGGDRKSASAVF